MSDIKVWKPRFHSVVLADIQLCCMRLRDFCLLMEGAKESGVSIPYTVLAVLVD